MKNEKIIRLVCGVILLPFLFAAVALDYLALTLSVDGKNIFAFFIFLVSLGFLWLLFECLVRAIEPRNLGRIKIIVGSLILLCLGMGYFVGRNYVNARSLAARESNEAWIACIDNLCLIDGAKQQWALDHKRNGADTPTWEELRPYVINKKGELPSCPKGGVYRIGTVSESPSCTFKGHGFP